MLFVDRLDITPVHVEKLRVGGGITALAAPSGAGKTRFLLAVADLVPNRGQIRLDDKVRERMPAPVWRRQVRYVSAEPAWWAPTARAHLPGLGSVAELAERIGLAAELFDEPIADLSTGERQRFGLIRALAANPPVLLLDEPTSALDEDTTRRVESEFTRLAEAGRIVVLVSHRREQVDRLAERVLTIEGGIIVERD